MYFGRFERKETQPASGILQFWGNEYLEGREKVHEWPNWATERLNPSIQPAFFSVVSRDAHVSPKVFSQ